MCRGFQSIPAVLAVALAASVSLAPVPVFAQAGKPWAVPRTPDGQPDLRGMWVNFDSTPFETAGTAPTAPVAVPQGTGVNPPSHWADHDSPMRAARPAMVVDPPDGKVPVMKWAEDKRAYDLEHVADNWVHQTPWERCITRGMPAGMFPAGYNNAYQFIQIPGYVVIVYEMIHDARVIPLDNRPRLGSKIRQWNGDARGHWEGHTLVIETANYNDKGMIATSAASGRARGVATSSEMHVIERITPLDKDTLKYEVTVTDPKNFAKSWSVMMPLNRDEKYLMLEYACHEGNMSLPNELKAGRAAQAK